MKLKQYRPRLNEADISFIIDGLKDLNFYSNNAEIEKYRNELVKRFESLNKEQ